MTDTAGLGEAGGLANGQAIFDRVMTQIKVRLGADVFNSWFGRMKLDDDAPSVVRLSVPTAFLKSWINSHYLELITELWRKEESRLLRLEIVVRSATRLARSSEPATAHENRKVAKPQYAAPGSVAPVAALKIEKQAARQTSEQEPRQQVIGSPLDSRYTFESFVEGPSNRVAFAAARAVADRELRGNHPVQENSGALQGVLPRAPERLLVIAEPFPRAKHPRVVRIAQQHVVGL